MFLDISFRYIFRKLKIAFFIIAPIVTIMAWIIMSLRYIELIALGNISLAMFFKLIAHTLPRILGTVLPSCALISLIAVIHDLKNNRELIILMSSGKSMFHIFSPMLLFSILIAMFTLYTQTMLCPSSHKGFEDVQESIKNRISMSLIKPGVFNVLGDSVVYVGGKTKSGLKNIFISHVSKGEHPSNDIITAAKGRCIRENGNYFIVLKNGYRQKLDENNSIVSTLEFSSFSYDITPFLKQNYLSKAESPNDKTQRELLEFAKNTKNLEMKRNCIAEYYSRLTTPFIPILNALTVAIFMLAPKGRKEESFDAFKSFLFGMVNQISVMTLVNLSTKNNKLIISNYAIILLALCILSIVLWKKKAR
ncbi:MAG: LptF/LptG family permease [Holosporales bacterium]|nr:LptF/LptG family permease [Holosporales bacterium]